MKMQPHRVGLDGAKDVRLTDTAFNHTVAGCMGTAGGGGGRGGFGALGGGCGISPDNGTSSTSIRLTIRRPQPGSSMPAGRLSRILRRATSRSTRSSIQASRDVHLHRGGWKTKLHGMIQFPSNFDPARKYPSLVSRRRSGVREQHRARDVRRRRTPRRILRLSYSEPPTPAARRVKARGFWTTST